MEIDTQFDRAIRHYRNEIAVIEHPLSHQIITREEYKQLISVYWDLHPMRLIWQILWETGMRELEVVSLQVDNVDFDRGLIGYKCCKPRKGFQNGLECKIYKSRVVPISCDLVKRIKAYCDLNCRTGTGFLFPRCSPRRMEPFMSPGVLNDELNRWRKTFGGRWLLKSSRGYHLIAPHSFRRSWIVRYMDRYHDPFECARAIGHSDPSTTFEYYQEIKEERLRSFVHSQEVIVHRDRLSKNQTFLNDF